jgi:predicted lipoprotein
MKDTSMRALIAPFLLIAAAVAATPARAAEDADYAKLNHAIVNQHIIPRYQQFMTATEKLGAAADKTCAASPATNLDGLKSAFVNAMHAWEGIQHVGFGPVEFFSRGSRIYFWPDPRSTVSRQLDELLNKRDTAALAADSFSKGSVAVQGFPALEILLYGDGAAAKLAASGEDAVYRCTLIKTIAHNLQTMGSEIYGEWTGGDEPYGPLLDKPGPEDLRFHHPSEVTVELFKSLYSVVEIISDHKLARPLGASVQAARPRLAEAWRSKQSLANIRTNLAAAKAMYDGENGSSGISAFVREVAGDTALDALMKRAFTQTLATATDIPIPLEDSVGKAASRPQFDKLAREARALKTLLVQRLAPALNIPVGFNQLDGD